MSTRTTTMALQRLSGSRSTDGFTLVELTAVLAILGLLMAIGIPAIASIRKRSAVTATRAMVQAVATAIAGYRQVAWTTSVPLAGGAHERRSFRMWDCNGDHLLDADPARDGAGTLAAADHDALIASGYRGFAAMAQPSVPRRLIRDGALIDAWGTRLRISYGVDGFYAADSAALFGTEALGVWSAGPDRRDVASGDASDAARADDITSWSSR